MIQEPVRLVDTDRNPLSDWETATREDIVSPMQPIEFTVLRTGTLLGLQVMGGTVYTIRKTICSVEAGQTFRVRNDQDTAAV